MIARGWVSLHPPPPPVPKIPSAKPCVSLTSKLIDIKRLQVLYSGHLRKTGGRGSYQLVQISEWGPLSFRRLDACNSADRQAEVPARFDRHLPFAFETARLNLMLRICSVVRVGSVVLVRRDPGGRVAGIDEVAPFVSTAEKPAGANRGISFIGSPHVQDEVRFSRRIRLEIANGHQRGKKMRFMLGPDLYDVAIRAAAEQFEDVSSGGQHLARNLHVLVEGHYRFFVPFICFCGRAQRQRRQPRRQHQRNNRELFHNRPPIEFGWSFLYLHQRCHSRYDFCRMPLRLSFRATYFSDSICVISRSPFPVRTFSIPQVIPAHGCEVLRTSGYWDATAPDSQPAGVSGSKRGTRCETSGGPFAHTAEPHHDAPRVGLEHVTRGNA